MKQVHADIRINLGIMPDESDLNEEDVVKLVEFLSLSQLEVEPLHVTFKDIDTGLITSERIFELKGGS